MIKWIKKTLNILYTCHRAPKKDTAGTEIEGERSPSVSKQSCYALMLGLFAFSVTRWTHDYRSHKIFYSKCKWDSYKGKIEKLWEQDNVLIFLLWIIFIIWRWKLQHIKNDISSEFNINTDTLLILSIVIYSAAQHALIQWNKSLQRVLKQVTNIWLLLIKTCS